MKTLVLLVAFTALASIGQAAPVKNIVLVHGAFVDGSSLVEALRLPGALLRPVWFEPTFHKFAGRACGGVQVHVRDARAFRAYDAYLRLIARVAQTCEGFAFRTETYEYVSDRPAIDLLTGGPEFREAVTRGALGDELLAWLCDAADFGARRRDWLLY